MQDEDHDKTEQHTQTDHNTQSRRSSRSRRALSFVGSWHETCRTAAPDLTDANRDALVGAMRRLAFQQLLADAHHAP